MANGLCVLAICTFEKPLSDIVPRGMRQQAFITRIAIIGHGVSPAAYSRGHRRRLIPAGSRTARPVRRRSSVRRLPSAQAQSSRLRNCLPQSDNFRRWFHWLPRIGETAREQVYRRARLCSQSRTGHQAQRGPGFLGKSSSRMASLMLLICVLTIDHVRA